MGTVDYIMILNPIYWVMGFIAGIVVGTGWVGGTLVMAMSGGAWAMISLLLADISSRDRGYFILWYLAYLFLGIIALLWFLYVMEFYATKRARKKVISERVMSPTPTHSDIVADAIKVYSPAQMKEFEIQDLVDDDKYDLAIVLAKCKLDHFEKLNDQKKIGEFKNLIGWLEHTKKLHEV
jgi:hypothetical protein